jgi:hypothetical protein
MGPSGSLSWWEKVSFTARVRHRLRSGIHRLRSVWWQIVQTAVAAVVAWFLAVLILGHERPAFAPIAAIISLVFCHERSESYDRSSMILG